MKFVIAMMLLAAAGAAATGARADEDTDYGVAPVATLRLADYSAPTPREIPGARVVSTAELRAWLAREGAGRPLLFDVLGGDVHDSLPGAVWLPGAGRGRSLEDAIQDQLAKTLEAATQGNRARVMVFFCHGSKCWLSYNAALRAAALGYSEVYWYRGGIEGWRAADGSLVPLRISWRRPPE